MKLFFITLSICTSLSIIAIVAFFYTTQPNGTNLPFRSNVENPQKIDDATASSMVSKIPAKKLAEQTVEFKEMTANLKEERSYIVLSLSAVTDDKDSTEEVKKREFQLRDYLIKELSKVSSEQMSDSVFVDSFIKKTKSYMNEQMEEGAILELYVTNKLVQ